jgi:hypothetical protein
MHGHAGNVLVHTHTSEGGARRGLSAAINVGPKERVAHEEGVDDLMHGGVHKGLERRLAGDLAGPGAKVDVPCERPVLEAVQARLVDDAVNGMSPDARPTCFRPLCGHDHNKVGICHPFPPRNSLAVLPRLFTNSAPQPTTAPQSSSEPGAESTPSSVANLKHGTPRAVTHTVAL